MRITNKMLYGIAAFALVAVLSIGMVMFFIDNDPITQPEEDYISENGDGDRVDGPPPIPPVRYVPPGRYELQSISIFGESFRYGDDFLFFEFDDSEFNFFEFTDPGMRKMQRVYELIESGVEIEGFDRNRFEQHVHDWVYYNLVGGVQELFDDIMFFINNLRTYGSTSEYYDDLNFLLDLTQGMNDTEIEVFAWELAESEFKDEFAYFFPQIHEWVGVDIEIPAGGLPCVYDEEFMKLAQIIQIAQLIRDVAMEYTRRPAQYLSYVRILRVGDLHTSLNYGVNFSRLGINTNGGWTYDEEGTLTGSVFRTVIREGEQYNEIIPSLNIYHANGIMRFSTHFMLSPSEPRVCRSCDEAGIQNPSCNDCVILDPSLQNSTPLFLVEKTFQWRFEL
ncbi:MAG: hypothetical protein FWC00_02535 [Firmicutes bacterium]|nr:hypothetical protein [Bacillota bacterium]